jgi:hypothetical protein
MNCNVSLNRSFSQLDIGKFVVLQLVLVADPGGKDVNKVLYRQADIKNILILKTKIPLNSGLKKRWEYCDY